MTLTPTEVKKLKSKLPTNGRKLIHEKIGEKVGLRMIELVISGSQSDKHGIINAAMEVIQDEKNRRAELSNKIKQL